MQELREEAQSYSNFQGHYPKSVSGMMAGAQVVGRGPAATQVGFEVLAKELTMLEQTAAQLVQRLVPVMRPRAEQESAGYAKDRPSLNGGCSEFYEKLRAATEQVERLRRQLAAVTDALEV